MGAEQAIGGTALATSFMGPVGLAASAVLGVAGAGLNMYNSNLEAGALREQGDIQYNDYMLQASQTEQQAHLYHESQIMQYSMSGVSVQGSPMAALDYTVQQSQLEVNSIRAKAAATRDLAYQKASQTSSNGVAKGLLSLGTTALNVYSSYNLAKTGGIFDGSGQTSHVWNAYEDGNIWNDAKVKLNSIQSKWGSKISGDVNDFA